MAGDDDAIPDRLPLRLVADQRARRGQVTTVVAAVATVAVTSTALVLALLGSAPVWLILLVAAAPVAVGVAVGLGVRRLIRRRRPVPPLATGGDRPTRRAVWRAIRTGQAGDERIDALARETADNTVRNSWLVVFWSVILGVQVVLLVVSVVAGTARDSRVFWVVGDVLLAAGLVILAFTLSRSRRYLRGADRG